METTVDPHRARRRVVAASLVLVGLLLVGGIVAIAVGDRTTSSTAAGDPVAAVRAAPAKVRGKRLGGQLTVETGGALQLQVAQTGVFDAAASRADVVLAGIGSGEVRLVVDGTTLYAKGAKPFGTRPWGRLSLADAGAIGSGPGQVSPSQLEAFLGLLEQVTSASDRGVEVVDGASLRHYATTIPRAALAQASPLFARAGAAQDPAVDVFLDEAGVPRVLSVSSETGGTKVQVTVRVRQVGVDAPVALPPAAEVVDIRLEELTAAIRG